VRVAITGGVAEGKSTVLGYLRELGFATAQSDDIAHGVLDLPEVQSELSESLGLPLPITPEQLREVVWHYPAARRALNRATHRHVLARLRESPAQFIEVPLLLEACLQAEFARVWVVTCGPEEQRKRMLARTSDAEQVDAILASQLPTAVKTAFADVVVRTNLDPATVQRFVANAVRCS
jgi:dephospho-CoA kinase